MFSNLRAEIRRPSFPAIGVALLLALICESASAIDTRRYYPIDLGSTWTELTTETATLGDTGGLIEVNMAGIGDGSLFGPGYVVRYTKDGVAHTSGEGLNFKQNPQITGNIVQKIANEYVWGIQMDKILKKCGCQN